MIQNYEELQVYQRGYKGAVLMYQMASGLPEAEKHGLISQIKRAATSIPLNIAEGYGKNETGKELVRFLSMAKGSSAEMEVLLNFSKDLGHIPESEYREAIERQEEVGKMLTGLIKSITEKTAKQG